MESLSGISEYLRNLEEMLKDSGDSLESLGNILEEAKVDLERQEEVGESHVSSPKEKRVVVFTQAPPKEFDVPFMRYSTPCGVEGIKAWDAQLNMEYGDNYITEEMLGKLGFVRLDYEDYGRKIVRDVNVNIHGHVFKVDFVVLEYGNADESEVVFGRDFMVKTKCMIDFALGEMRIDVDDLVEEKVGKGEIVKMGKANRKKTPLNKLTQPSTPKNESSSSSSPPKTPQIVKPLTQQQKEAILENLETKFKEFMEEKPVIDVLNNYMIYRKKLDAVMMARARLEDKNFDEVARERIVENGLPKKESDMGNFVLPIKVNGTDAMYALADTGASVNVMPYHLYKRLGLGNTHQINIILLWLIIHEQKRWEK